MKTLTYVAGLFLVLAATSSAQTREYQLSIDSAMQVRSPGQPKPKEMTAVTLLSYAHDRKDAREDVLIRSLNVKVSTEGKTLMDREMSRAGASFQQGTQSATPMPFDQAPPALQKILKEFDTPLAKVTLDAQGAESARELLVDKESVLLENGMVDNARLMHPPFPADQDRWESPAKLAMGNGQYAKGNLTYEKKGTRDDGTVEVQVAGELKAEGKFGPADIKTGIYKVKGEQAYDPASKTWKSGQLDIDVTLDLLVGGTPGGSTTGVMKLGMSQK